jgi:high-affinity iron transporter
MLINSVIIILREVLEASLIMGVLLALSQLNALPKNWCTKAILIGLVGAFIYANNLLFISALQDGIGQEMVNIGLYVLIFISVLIIIYTVGFQSSSTLATFAMLCCLAVAIIREGAEIMVYIQGFAAIPELRTPVLLGGAIGAGIGISIGVFIYYSLVSMSVIYGVRFSLLVLILIAGGVVSQATQMLLQADLVPSQLPIWDTSSFISEQSTVGQVMFAMMGYEATPTLLQVLVYITSIVLSSALASVTLRRYKQAVKGE